MKLERPAPPSRHDSIVTMAPATLTTKTFANSSGPGWVKVGPRPPNSTGPSTVGRGSSHRRRRRTLSPSPRCTWTHKKNTGVSTTLTLTGRSIAWCRLTKAPSSRACKAGRARDGRVRVQGLTITQKSEGERWWPCSFSPRDASVMPRSPGIHSLIVCEAAPKKWRTCFCSAFWNHG